MWMHTGVTDLIFHYTVTGVHSTNFNRHNHIQQQEQQFFDTFIIQGGFAFLSQEVFKFPF